MKNRDWLFIDEDRIYAFRSAGVLIHDGKILIQRGVHDAEYALPGGHVAWGETSADTLIRECKEELGADIAVDRLIWVEEVFWKWGERDAHTVCHYHLVSLRNPFQLPIIGTFASLDTDESKLIFQWVDINKLHEYKVYPVFLKDKSMHLSDCIEHFVTRE